MSPKQRIGFDIAISEPFPPDAARLLTQDDCKGYVAALDPATEAELDAAAEITPEDIERAKGVWRETAPPAFKYLLDAQADGEPAA